MALRNTISNDKFLSILADGTMRMSVPEGTEGAVRREYETSDGKVGVKNELVFNELEGIISKIAFWEGDFGKLIQLTIVDGDEDPVVLSVGTSSSYGEDLMKKLPNVVTSLPVIIKPFAFEDEKGKKKKGVTITQNGVKLDNFYYDKEAKKNINGYPIIKMKKNMSSDDWKMHFMEARMFLIDDISERFGLGVQEVSADDANDINAEKVFAEM